MAEPAREPDTAVIGLPVAASGGTGPNPSSPDLSRLTPETQAMVEASRRLIEDADRQTAEAMRYVVSSRTTLEASRARLKRMATLG